ncbi:Kelch repeat-containing protein [Flavobacterium faecale]|uniref:Kelch repeat-containing protein n=1 Tax=Flavobacterium faecale TaxID=1355330 RepID=UPI003AAEAA40
MRKTIIQIIILTITFYSCKSKKTTIDDNLTIRKESITNRENRLQITNPDKINKVKFVPESKQFQLNIKESMPFPEYDFGAELYNGKIYAFLDTYRNRYNNKDHNHGDVCVYDIEKDSWTKINVIPKSQPVTKSILVGKRIYLIGGTEFSDLIQVYDIEKNIWEESLKLPFGMYWCTAETFEDKIYIMGGYALDKEKKGTRSLSDVQIFDTKTKSWTKGAEMPRKMQMPNSLKYNNEFYVWDINPKVMLKYNIAKDMWINVSELNDYVKGAQEGIVYKNKFIFISGQNESGLKSKSTKKIYQYDPITKIYEESFNDLKIGRHYNYGVFEYKDKIYLLGGREDQEWNPMNNVIEIELK